MLLLGLEVVLVVLEWGQCHDCRDGIGRTSCSIRRHGIVERYGMDEKEVTSMLV